MSEAIASTPLMARILNVSEMHLGRLSKAGTIPNPVSRGKWEIAPVVQAFIAHRVGEKTPGLATDAKAEQLLLSQERRRKISADADRQERDNAVASGQLIDAEFARSVFFEAARRDRNAWMAWTSTVAPLIAADLGMDVEPVNEALDQHVHEHISALGEPKCAIGAPLPRA